MISWLQTRLQPPLQATMIFKKFSSNSNPNSTSVAALCNWVTSLQVSRTSLTTQPLPTNRYNRITPPSIPTIPTTPTPTLCLAWSKYFTKIWRVKIGWNSRMRRLRRSLATNSLATTKTCWCNKSSHKHRRSRLCNQLNWPSRRLSLLSHSHSHSHKCNICSNFLLSISRLIRKWCLLKGAIRITRTKTGVLKLYFKTCSKKRQRVTKTWISQQARTPLRNNWSWPSSLWSLNITFLINNQKVNSRHFISSSSSRHSHRLFKFRIWPYPCLTQDSWIIKTNKTRTTNKPKPKVLPSNWLKIKVWVIKVSTRRRQGRSQCSNIRVRATQKPKFLPSAKIIRWWVAGVTAKTRCRVIRRSPKSSCPIPSLQRFTSNTFFSTISKTVCPSQTNRMTSKYSFSSS